MDSIALVARHPFEDAPHLLLGGERSAVGYFGDRLPDLKSAISERGQRIEDIVVLRA